MYEEVIAGQWEWDRVGDTRRIRTQFYLKDYVLEKTGGLDKYVGSVTTWHDHHRVARSHAFVPMRTPERPALDPVMLWSTEATCLRTEIEERHAACVQRFLAEWPEVLVLPGMQLYLFSTDHARCAGMISEVAQAKHEADQRTIPSTSTLVLDAVQQAALEHMRVRFGVTHDLFSARELARMAFWQWRIAQGTHAHLDCL